MATEDAALYRDALGAGLPEGLPAALLEPVEAPFEQLLERAARTRVPFPTAELAERYALEPARVEAVLAGLEARGRLSGAGSSWPGGSHSEWCDPEVLRRVRRRSLERLRREVAPVAGPALARFLTRWQRVGGADRGTARLDEVLAQLEGVAVSFAELERALLPARVRGFDPRQLDELGASGQIVWIGGGALGRRDGRIALYRREAGRPSCGACGTAGRAAGFWRGPSSNVWPRAAACFFAELSAGCGRAGRDRVDGGAVESGLGGSGDQRHLRVAARVAQPGEGSPSEPPPTAGRSRAGTLVSGGGAAGRPAERHGARPRARSRPVGPLRRRQPGRRHRPRASAAASGSLYPVYRAMEESGKLRRGYFAEGLTGAQFAFAGAVDRLREARPGPRLRPARARSLRAVRGPTRPTPTAPCWTGRNRRWREPPRRAVRPAPASCWSTAAWSSTWTAPPAAP